MSPSKSLRYDSTQSEDLLLLQKLEEVGSSVKVESKCCSLHIGYILFTVFNLFSVFSCG